MKPTEQVDGEAREIIEAMRKAIRSADYVLCGYHEDGEGPATITSRGEALSRLRAAQNLGENFLRKILKGAA